MHAYVNKVVGMALAALLATAGMTACGEGDSGPKSTEELLGRYEAIENRENFTYASKIDVAFDGGQAIVLESTGQVMPDASHATTQASIAGYDGTFERYVEAADEGYVQYRSLDLAGTHVWTKSVVDEASPMSALTAHDLLKDATFAATEEGYTLCIPGSAFVPACLDLGMESFPDILQVSGVQSIQSAEAVYTFDKDGSLQKISFAADAEGDGTAESPVVVGEAGPNGAIKSADVEFTLADYGSVTAEAIAVPQNVRDSAIDLDEAMAKISALKDQVGAAVDGLTDRAKEGLDQLGAYLEGVDASSILDQLTQKVSDVAGSDAA